MIRPPPSPSTWNGPTGSLRGPGPGTALHGENLRDREAPCALRSDPSRGVVMPLLNAEPFELSFEIPTTALVIIDMQRDFVLPGGFGEALGNDTSLLQAAVEPTQRVLDKAREAGMFVIHTREGHRPDLSDCPSAKLTRGGKTFIGTDGPMGRILVRGEQGHDIIHQLAPKPGEPVIDKPGKGSFHATDLHQILLDRGIKTLIVCGVTLEVCVHTTVREANDRGYECVVLSDCVASYFPEFQRVGLEMIKAQGGIFGWVSDAERFLAAPNPWGRRRCPGAASSAGGLAVGARAAASCTACS